MAPPAGKWRDLHDTVVDYCAISMAGHALEGLRDALAKRLASHFGVSGKLRRATGSQWTCANTCAELRAAAKGLGILSSGTKDALVERICEHECAARGCVAPSIPVNVVPQRQRANFKLSHGRMIKLGDAQREYSLSAADLETWGVPREYEDHREWCRAREREMVRDARTSARAMKRMVMVRRVRRLANAREQRKARLVRELARLGCKLRSDSRLCDGYIDDGKGRPVEIAQTMAEMAFCFAHTKYRAILAESIRGELDYKGRYDYDELSECARHSALEQYVDDHGLELSVVPEHLHTTAQAQQAQSSQRAPLPTQDLLVNMPTS